MWPSRNAKRLEGTHRDLGEQHRGVRLVEAVEEPTEGVVGEVVEIDLVTQQQLPVLVLKRGADALQRVASAEGIEDHGQSQGAGAVRYLAGDQAIDRCDDSDPMGVGRDNRKVMDFALRDFSQLHPDRQETLPARDGCNTHCRARS